MDEQQITVTSMEVSELQCRPASRSCRLRVVTTDFDEPLTA
jgi:hypothetical protein